MGTQVEQGLVTLGEILFSADPVWLRLPGLEFTELQGSGVYRRGKAEVDVSSCAGLGYVFG